MKVITLILLALIMPGLAQAADLMQRRIDLGAGYSAPVKQAGKTILQSNVDASMPSLDCSNINWKSQLQANLQSDLGLAQLHDLGQSAVAASESYLMSALRPTMAETIQNALKNANFTLRSSINECHQIQAQLTKSDPLGMYRQKKQAQAVMAGASKGETFDQAVANSGKVDTNFSLDQSINGSTQIPPAQKAALVATMGDFWVKNADGSRQTGGSQPDAQMVERVYATTRKDALAAITARFEGQTSCQQPIFADPASQKRLDATAATAAKALANAKPGQTPPIDRQAVMAGAVEQQLAQQNEGILSCSAVDVWKGYTPDDRAAILQVVADHVALQGIRLQLQQAEQNLATLKSEHPDQAQLLSQVSSLDRLQGEFRTMKANIDDRVSVQASMIRAHREAQKQKQELANERLRNMDTMPTGAPADPSLMGY